MAWFDKAFFLKSIILSLILFFLVVIVWTEFVIPPGANEGNYESFFWVYIFIGLPLNFVLMIVAKAIVEIVLAFRRHLLSKSQMKSE